MKTELRTSIWCGYLVVASVLGVAWHLATSGRPVDSLSTYGLVLLLAGGYALVCHAPSEWRPLLQPLPADDRARTQQRLVALAARYRSDGARGLERELAPCRSSIEAQGVRLVADGADAVALEAALRRTAQQLRDVDEAPARLWAVLGRGAVNGGVLLSLIQMSVALQQPGPVAQATVAAACSATIYGFLLGWFVCHPQACRRRHAAARAAAVNELWIDGLLAIAAGVHPRRLEEQLVAAGPPALRVQVA